MNLKAYEIGSLIVFAANGVTAKSFAAPLIRPSSEWAASVADWVELMATRRADLDHLLELGRSGPYVSESI